MPQTCSVEGCETPRSAKGYCGMHYRRWKIHGDPLVTLRPDYGKGRNEAHNQYVRVWCPGHPVAAATGYAYEHRKVAWDAGIISDPSQHVHHINGVRDDNRPENLEATTNPEHAHHHHPPQDTCVRGHSRWYVRPDGKGRFCIDCANERRRKRS